MRFHVADVLSDKLLRYRVVVNDRVVAVNGVRVFNRVLQVDPILDCTQIVSQVDVAGGLDSGEDDATSEGCCLGRHYLSLVDCNN